MSQSRLILHCSMTISGSVIMAKKSEQVTMAKKLKSLGLNVNNIPVNSGAIEGSRSTIIEVEQSR